MSVFQIGVMLLVLSQLNSAQKTKGTWFDRIIIFFFENHSYDEVAEDPTFNMFFKLGNNLLNYYAVTHPSQPNYWCALAGDHFDKNTDDNVDLNYTNLIDLFDTKKITWKAYQQDYPENCNPSHNISKYYRKHNPFISFDNIRNNATRCANIVNAKQLDIDLKAGTLPQYSFFTPNIDNDAHNTNISFAGAWLDSYLTPRLPLFPRNTLFLLTWDEDDYSEDNHIFTVLFGTMIQPSTSNSTLYNHYSLLRTVEDNWGLGNLGRNDKSAIPFF